jgi:hypothetical protein
MVLQGRQDIVLANSGRKQTPHSVEEQLRRELASTLDNRLGYRRCNGSCIRRVRSCGYDRVSQILGRCDRQDRIEEGDSEGGNEAAVKRMEV